MTFLPLPERLVGVFRELGAVISVYASPYHGAAYRLDVPGVGITVRIVHHVSAPGTITFKFDTKHGTYICDPRSEVECVDYLVERLEFHKFPALAILRQNRLQVLLGALE